MPYLIQRDETLAAAVQRIMDERLARARRHLTDESTAIDERIHDARKRLKEIRALVRLVRDPLGKQYAIENAAYRDAGRALAGVRDAAAVMESFVTLRSVRRVPPTVARRTRLLLRRQLRAIPPKHLSALAATVLEAIAAAQARLPSWPPIHDSFDPIAPGLLRAYRRSRSAMDAAVEGAMPSHFHEWRKAVKVQWYHALLLRDLWPEMMKSWAGVLESLSRALGDHHDLFLLRKFLVDRQYASGRGPGRGLIGLLDQIDDRQRELERESLRIGALVHAERPRAWLARIERAWSLWRA